MSTYETHYDGRELTLKETNTASLLSRLGEIHERAAQRGPFNPDTASRIEAEAIEQELEERAEWEQKVSRW